MPLLRILLLNATLGLAGYWSARHGFRSPPGATRVLSAWTIAWAWATLGMEILGCLGFLTYGPLLAWAAAGCVVGLYLRGSGGGEATTGDKEPLAAGRDRRWEAGAILALGLVFWVTMVQGLNALMSPVKVASDGPIYHLYFAARWWKEGRISLVAAPFGDVAVTYFPAVGDLWFTWLMIGWGGERLAKVGQMPFLLISGIAAFGCARRLGAGTSSAVIATCWFVTCMPFLFFTLQANVDTILVASYLVATFFFLRYALGDEGKGALVLGALASGGVLGTKPTGIVFGALLFGSAALAILARRETIRRALGDLLLVAVCPLVMVGFWYGRSLWLTGNPLYPLHVEAFGHVWLAGWYGASEMQLSQYYFPVGDWRSLVDILLTIFDPRQVPVWILALTGGWALKCRTVAEDRWVWMCSAMAVANVAAYWLLIPYRTQQRFMLQAVGLLVVPLARLLDRGRWLRAMGTALLMIHLMTMQSWPFGPNDREPPWDLSAFVPNTVPPLLIFPYLHKLSRGVTPQPDDVSWTVVMGVIGTCSVGLAWLWSRPGRHGSTRAALASLALLAALIGLVNPYNADPRALFYEVFPDYRRGWLMLDRFAGPSGARIAYAGTNLPYYLLGAGLKNQVRYVNVDEHRGWLMHDYHREAQRRGEPTWPNPWPTWDRLNPDYDAWLANLRAEEIQLLAVASMRRPRGALPDVDPDLFPIERRWAESHPESFEPLYGVAEEDPKFRIYRVRPGELADPPPR